MSRFRPVDRDTDFLFPPSVQEWLPEGHFARYVVDVVEQFDLSELEAGYSRGGKPAYHPAMLLALLIYGYATGVHSSRKIERATYDSVAFRYIAGNQHPDHDTIAAFRRRFGAQVKAVFMQVLQIARANQLTRFGTVSLDGTKISANASRHSALSYGHASRIEAQLQAEIDEMLELAERADQTDLPDGLDLPAEIRRREARIEKIAEAKAEIEARARARHEKEQAAYEEKLRRRAETTRKTGQKPRGREPEPPRGPEPEDKGQVNLTDPESRIMPVRGKAFDQCYNAQGAVDTESMLLLAVAVTDQPNDKEQVAPMLDALEEMLPEGTPAPTLIADAGYCSETNLARCEARGTDVLMAVGRESHHPAWRERFEEPAPLDAEASRIEQMAHRLKTKAGRELYRLRKQTVEPVFGIIKAQMGLRMFSLRGLKAVAEEWTLAGLAWNLKRMGAMQGWSVCWT
jgi:transposase